MKYARLCITTSAIIAFVLTMLVMPSSFVGPWKRITVLLGIPLFVQCFGMGIVYAINACRMDNKDEDAWRSV